MPGLTIKGRMPGAQPHPSRSPARSPRWIAARTNGIHAELAHRVESAARVLADGGSANLAGALERGLRAGRATG